LDLNIVVPFISQAGNGEGVYKRTEFQAAYNLDGIGKVVVGFGGYNGDSGNYQSTAGSEAGHTFWNPGAMYGYFQFTKVENLMVEIALKAPFYQIEDDKYKKFSMNTGLGVRYEMGAFGVKARVQGNFSGYSYDDYRYTEGVSINFNVMPYYAISDSLSVYLSFGLHATGLPSDSTGKDYGDPDKATWYLNPYIVLKGGPGTFYAGVQLDGNDNNSDKWGYNNDGDWTTFPKVKWAIPIGINIGF
jgi:hypothetical protein